MSSRRFGYILLPALVVGFCTTLLTATASFRYRHPQAAGEHFRVTRAGTILHVPNTGQESAANALMAKAVAVESEHDFGLMNPLTMGSHAFIVHNQGTAPLTLQAGPTSCKCTLSDVSDEPIPPGGTGHVTVQWNTGGKNRFYSHEASVYTNDPRQRTLQFAVRGVVRVQLAVAPPAAHFDRINPDATARKRLLVYSQVWDEFDLVDIQSSLPGLTWEIEPASAATLADHEALAAHWLVITTPAELPAGHFSAWLRFRLQPPTAPHEAIEHEVAVTGKTLKRLAVYGADIDAEGMVSFGSVTQGHGATKRLLLKVRDGQTTLPVQRIETTPAFLEVRLIPREATTTNGLLYLEVAIPPSAPRSDYLGKRPAKIRIEFDHPRIADLELTASFAVVN